MHTLLYVVWVLTVVNADFKFKDTSASWDARVDDLVGRLSLDEIQSQMGRAGFGNRGGPAPGIPRLGISPYSWNTECLHGDSRAGSATAYPQSIGLAASWSTSLISRMAEAIGEEVRGKYNSFVSKHQYGDHKGLSCFSPVINIMRDPRWGRNQETYGEDPYLTGQIAAAYVHGLQGDDPRYLRANAGCKHFDVHGGPEKNRFSFDAKVAERDWRMTFLPAFRTCVKAGTMNLMCSYNRVNGVPACANKHLLTDVLRGEWGFKGYVVSDQGAIEQIRTRHHYLNTPVDNAAACVSAGCNLELSSNLAKPDFFYIVDAVKQGKLNETDVRDRVKELFYARMRLGEFDPPSMNQYSLLNETEIESQAHQDLAEEAAMKSFVLLKNSHNTLPFKSKFNKAAVVGPFTYQGREVFGSYKANTDDKYISTVEDGLKGLATSVISAEGCTDAKCNTYQTNMVSAAVKDAEVVFLCLGLGQELEDEFIDRNDLHLPSGQLRLISDVKKNTASNVPIILLLFNAGPVDVSNEMNDPRVAAIMAVFYPAQAAGTALQKVLSNGDTGPGGRLPYTWYKDLHGFPSIGDYSMTGRTYRYTDSEPLFPFGYGLSYSSFHYRSLNLDKTSIKAGDDVSVHVVVKNNGHNDADEVVQLYISWEDKQLPVPKLQLASFERVHLPAQGHKTVKLSISHETMAYWGDDKTGWVITPSKLKVYVGGQQPNQKMDVGSNVLEAEITITSKRTLGIY